MEPTQLENFVLVDGIYRTMPGWQKAAMHYEIPNVTYGHKFDVRFFRRGIYDSRGNWKWFRVWHNWPSVRYPNWYLGRPNDSGDPFVYTEHLPFGGLMSQLTHPYVEHLMWPPRDGRWRLERYEWQASSGIGKADGHLRISIDGDTILACDTWQCDWGMEPGIPNHICIQDVPANLTTPLLPTDYVEIADVRIVA